MPAVFHENACCAPGVWSAERTWCWCVRNRQHRRQWRLRRLEAMARFQLYYGVTPIGPHRQVPPCDVTTCDACLGEGVLAAEHGRYRVCDACHGWGRFPFPNAPALVAWRTRVAAAFPEAVVSGADQVQPRTFRALLERGATFVHDLRGNRMVVAEVRSS